MKKQKTKKNNGFTLIELMVASSIFAIIMLISIGALLTVFGTAKNSRALRLAMDNVNYAVESMTRSIRMGTNYTCVESGSQINLNGNPDPRDCLEGGSFLAFIPQDGSQDQRVGYQLAKISQVSSDVDNKDGGGEAVDHGKNLTLKRYDNKSNSSGVPIISPDVSIQRLNFIVKGSAPDDGIQASVYIIMEGSVMVKGTPVSFSIQTMASQRNF